MLSPLLAVLTMGMVPLHTGTDTMLSPVTHLPVSPPTEEIILDVNVSASGVLVFDLQSGQRMYSLQANVQRPMGSLVKLMTALIIIENHNLNEFVTVPEGVEDIVGMRAYLPEGQQFTVGDLLSALLIASGNDAAETLAIFHSGTTGAFVEEMNARAQVLGLRGTSFADPVGFDHPRQWSTPQDIAWLTSFVFRFDPIRERMSKRGVRIYSRASQRIDLVHTHALLHADTSVIAGKTGTTTGAGECLVSIVEKDGREYMVVLLNSLQRYKDMSLILDVLTPEDDVELVVRK